jgi:hypothetical protein
MTLPGPVATPVVFDVNVLVQAIASGNSPFLSWPSPHRQLEKTISSWTS